MDPLDSIWYFPGDPPVFEMLGGFSLLLIGLLVILGALVFLITAPRSFRRRRRFSLLMILLLISLLIIPLGVAVLGISMRHFGEWAELKTLIRRYSEIVEQEVQRSGDSGQITALGMPLLHPAPTFQFKALREPVRLRIMQTTPPYIGVDFGSGANAVFDPVTMVCLYSD